jgi:hypothetical protein
MDDGVAPAGKGALVVLVGRVLLVEDDDWAAVETPQPPAATATRNIMATPALRISRRLLAGPRFLMAPATATRDKLDGQ